MATLVLAAAGSAIGSAFGGGTILGMTGAVIGRAVGATMGQVIDRGLFSSGSDPVRTGKIDRLRLTGASEGAQIARIWGRVRIGGQVIWASQYKEHLERGHARAGGKGAPAAPEIEQFNYSVSLAIALCEGPILRVGRIWADGNEIDPSVLNMRVYLGDEQQLPDPAIAAIEGLRNAPAYRGIAYVVFENLRLARFGNRVPQFSFEVVRGARSAKDDKGLTLGSRLSAVAIVPGTGEYALANGIVREARKHGRGRALNRYAATGQSDFASSMSQLAGEMPNLRSASLVVSWFGTDLRCGNCQIQPRIESTVDSAQMPWRAGGLTRAQATTVPQQDGKKLYGGTPADASVIEAIQHLRQSGKEVMFYPFILMEQLAGNGAPDPWTGAADQPALPWRGRITVSKAPGQEGSPDRSDVATQQIADFLGSATPETISIVNNQIVHLGANDWGYRRFILHYARLCQLAGGVDAFCIGSELRGLTQVRGEGDVFPFVQALKQIAAEVRQILGPSTKIGYAADWSEYFGYVENGNRYFNLDPLWADENIDFVGIDNYMPMADWRNDRDNKDGSFESVYDLEYLKKNIEGGEGYDWYYDSEEAAHSQRRTLIGNSSDQDWMWRYKDIRSWWQNLHHEVLDGNLQMQPTDWVPQSKPIWFTEFGCAAMDLAANQPNLFIDPKSSESGQARSSHGRRDDLIQMQYYRALTEYWGDGNKNPTSPIYRGKMIDLQHSFAWAWDVRPYPAFPTRSEIWSDAQNYFRGHWLNGRSSSVALRDLVDEVLDDAGIKNADTGALCGLVRGYCDTEAETLRSLLQPLMMSCEFDCFEIQGQLVFKNRVSVSSRALSLANIAARDDGDVERVWSAATEASGEVHLGFIQADANYDASLAAAALPVELHRSSVTEAELQISLTPEEASSCARRLLSRAQSSSHTVRFDLPLSQMGIVPGDVVTLGQEILRIDRIAEGRVFEVEASKIDPLRSFDADSDAERPQIDFGPEDAGFSPLFLDLPLMDDDSTFQPPFVAISADVWPGSFAVWKSARNDGFELDTMIDAPTVTGVTETAITAQRVGIWDEANRILVSIGSGDLESVATAAVLNGSNIAAIGDGTEGNWEIFQYSSAVLVAPNTWEISGLLRGQFGSDSIMPQVWPAGSQIVLLTTLPTQLKLKQSELGLSRNYRIGIADLGYVSENAVELSATFTGNFRKPYRVCHLRRTAGNEVDEFKWIRRTRIGGDSWLSNEVPNGETTEHYLIRVAVDGVTVREMSIIEPNWVYTAEMRMSDGVTGGYVFHVAQISEQFGVGPFNQIVVLR